MLSVFRLAAIPRRLPLFRTTVPRRSFSRIRHPEQILNSELGRDPCSEKNRTSQRIARLQSLLEVGNKEQITSFLERFHSSTHVQNDYESSIALLLQSKHVEEAIALYVNMVEEGLVPSSSADAKMVMAAMEFDVSEELSRELRSVMQTTLARYSQNRFVYFLHSISKLGAKPEVLHSVLGIYYAMQADDFVPNRDILAHQVDMMTRRGDVGEALEILKERKIKGFYPYLAMITAIQHTRHWDDDSVARILDVMHSNGLKPNNPIFSKLISIEVRNKRLREAFSVYEMVKELSKMNHGVHVDGYMLASLFNGLAQRRSSRVSRRAMRTQIDRPDDIPLLTPRQLWIEMLHFLVPNVPDDGARPRRRLAFVMKPHQLTADILDVTIRAFMQQRDYLAALVVLRIMNDFRIHPTTRTYHVILGSILRRVEYEILCLRKQSEIRWADLFLGIASPTVSPSIDMIADLSEDFRSRSIIIKGKSVSENGWVWVDHVLTLAKQKGDYNFDGNLILPGLGRVSQPRPDDDNATVHSVPLMKEIISGRATVTTDDRTFSHVPLSRLLRKAYLAQLPPPSGMPSLEYIQEAEQQAVDELVPDFVGRYAKLNAKMGKKIRRSG